MILKNYIMISKEKWKRKCLLGIYVVFCQILGITEKTLDNYSNFKNKFLFNNDSILEINDYNNRSWGNVSFTELCEKDWGNAPKNK